MDIEQVVNDYHEFIGLITDEREIDFNNPFHEKVIKMVEVSTISALRDEDLIKLVTSPTGSGKSTCMYAMCAALEKNNIPCSIICRTNRECENAYRELFKIMGLTTKDARRLVVFTGDHSLSNTGENDLIVQDRFSKTDILSAQVFIGTHERILKGIEEDRIEETYYNGSTRKVQFIDEKIDFVWTKTIRPSEVKLIAEHIRTSNHTLYEGLMAVFYRMQTIEERIQNARTYSVASIINDTEFDQISNAYEEILFKLRLGVDREQANANRFTLNKMMEFLECASKRYVFYRYGKSDFIFYGNKYDNENSYVIMDATADIEGVLPLLSDDEPLPLEIPRIDYRNVETFYFDSPEEFKGKEANDRINSGNVEYLNEFVNHIVEEVKRNSTGEDNVLIVAPKVVVKHMIARHGIENPSNDLEMCTVTINDLRFSAIYWGNFIGSNDFRNCNVVFLFSEFIKPRHVYVAENKAWRNSPIEEIYLNRQSGREIVDEVRDLRENNLAMWFMQLASRGSSRSVVIDSNGNAIAQPMRVYSNWKFLRLCEVRNRVFPGSPEIKSTEPLGLTNTNADKLITYLFNTNEVEIPQNKCIEEIGLSSANFNRTWNEIKEFREAFGWKKKKASELGLANVGRYVLVKPNSSPSI